MRHASFHEEDDDEDDDVDYDDDESKLLEYTIQSICCVGHTAWAPKARGPFVGLSGGRTD